MSRLCLQPNILYSCTILSRNRYPTCIVSSPHLSSKCKQRSLHFTSTILRYFTQSLGDNVGDEVLPNVGVRDVSEFRNVGTILGM
eukprot:UN31532